MVNKRFYNFFTTKKQEINPISKMVNKRFYGFTYFILYNESLLLGIAAKIL